MADSNPQRRAEPIEFLDDDPFAELTRIMGHDPRADEKAETRPQAEEPAAAAEPEPAMQSASAEVPDEAIDLEQELFSDLDFSEFDETPDPADWRSAEAAPAVAATSAEPEPVHTADVEDDMAVDFDMEMTGWEAEPAVAETTAEPEPVRVPDIEDDTAVDFDLDLEMTGWEAEPEVGAEPVVVAEPALEVSAEPLAATDTQHDWQAEEAGHDIADTFELDDDLGESLERELFSSSLTEDDLQPATADVAAAPAAAIDATPETDDAGEPDFDRLLDLDVEEQVDEPVAAPDRWQASDDVQAAPEAPRASSLEDELNMLLASHGFGSGRAGAATSVPENAPFANAAPAAPAAKGYGLANYPERNHPTGSHAVPGLEAPLATLDDDDMVDIFGEEMKVASTPPQPAPSHWQQPIAPAAATVAAGAYAGAAYAAAAPSAQAMTSRPQAAAPDIETLDVSESAQVLADDLDIPDLDFGDVSTSASIYDDLDGEFSQAMEDISFDDSASRAGWTAAPAARPALPAASYEEPPQAAYFEQPDARWEQQASVADDSLDFDSELESAITMAAFDNQQPAVRPARRRGMMAAAVVAGVAVIGGLGVFGMSYFGEGSDGPVVVRADVDPMKVRPENPGGTTVPNQDSEAYQRVAGGASDAAPEQSELISTTEEPVDLAARDTEAEAEAALPPAISDGTVEADEALAPAMQPKSEERVAATEEAEPQTVEDLLVTPRRVRTMIVRPDGSLVAREEPAAAPAADAPSVDANAATSSAPSVAAAIPSLAPAGQPLPGEEAADAQALATDEDAGPVVDTPDTVAVVPSQRREPTAESQPARVAAAPAPVQQPQPVVQQPAPAAPIAATPASAPAAAAPSGAASSEWSMQIASQPTADSAQATYQDLARRYGGVLEGRGVNIVRADIAGKGTYYRVRIPASNRDEAIQLCTRYKSAGGSCFVSR